MKHTPGGLHRLRLLPAVLVLALAGCASDEPWTFALSRAVYGEPHDISDPGSAEAALLILVLPFVLDVIALPVTLMRDLIVLD